MLCNEALFDYQIISLVAGWFQNSFTSILFFHKAANENSILVELYKSLSEVKIMEQTKENDTEPIQSVLNMFSRLNIAAGYLNQPERYAEQNINLKTTTYLIYVIFLAL